MGRRVPWTIRTARRFSRRTTPRRGLRVLAVAQRALPADLTTWRPETVECELTFLGLIAMLDPPRPEVAEAVARCHRAGIRIIMITGDYGLTAESIARRIGIIHGPQPRLITGGDLAAMDDEALHAALQGEVIFARVTPEQKLQVVTALQAMGHVVAVTGDGVNDAPALKKADIGVAMGMSGTDVAREAADMVLPPNWHCSCCCCIRRGSRASLAPPPFPCATGCSCLPGPQPYCWPMSAVRRWYGDVWSGTGA